MEEQQIYEEIVSVRNFNFMLILRTSESKVLNHYSTFHIVPPNHLTFYT